MRYQPFNIRGFLASVAVCCGCAASLTSCSDDVENIFGESVANRQAKAIDEYTHILESNAQGWVLDYYPSDRSMGGVAYTALFREGNVTMTCEQEIDNTVNGTKYAVGEEVSSAYRIVTEQGVVLSFDTYNPLFHYWSQPISSDANGFESDYEFTFVSASTDSVVLRGKKYGNLLKMYPLHESAADYVQKVAATHAILGNIPRKRAVVDGQSKPLTVADNQIVFTEDGRDYSVSYIHTDRGVRFYQPITLNGVTVQEMTLNTETRELSSTDGRVLLPMPTTIERFVGTMTQWHFIFSTSGGDNEMCDELKDIVMDCITETMRQSWETVSDIYIGVNKEPATTDSHRMVLGWSTYLATWSSISYNIGHGIEMAVEDEQRQLISIRPTEGANLFYNYTFWQPLVDFIGESSPYVITFDDEYNPTRATLTSQQNTTRWFTLCLK